MKLKSLFAIVLAVASLVAPAANGRTEVPAVAGARTPAPGIFTAGRLAPSDVERGRP